jgi:hypothetical protein
MQRSIAVGDGLSDFRRQAGWTRALKGHGPYGNITGWFPLCGPVAQGIEQRFPVPCVGGSNPSRPASLFHRKAQSFVEILPLGPPALLHLNCTPRREDLLRRSRGEGSIYRRKDRLWVTRYKATGRRKYLYRKTRKAVADKLRGRLSWGGRFRFKEECSVCGRLFG